MMRPTFVPLILCAAAFTQLPALAQVQTLKDGVALAEATPGADSIDLHVPAGTLALDLHFRGTSTLSAPTTGTLSVSNLRATTAPGTVLPTTLASGGKTSGADSPLDVTLTREQPLLVTLKAQGLGADATYKGTLHLAALKDTRSWTVTLTTGARGVLVVDHVAPLQFERQWDFWPSDWWANGTPLSTSGKFKFSVSTKAPVGPLTHFDITFVPSTSAASKVIHSNFDIRNFTIENSSSPFPGVTEVASNAAQKQPGQTPPGKTQSGQTQSGQTQSGQTQSAQTQSGQTQQGQTQPEQGQPQGQVATPAAVREFDTRHWFEATVSGLQPGEYSGTLQFLADEVSSDAADSRMALAINVHDPAIVPIVVLVAGSLIGWFSTKYLVAARKANDMARSVRQLRQRADDLARGGGSREGWEFSNEATSYALIKVRVMCSRLADLTKSSLPMLVEEAELTALKTDAETRLTKIEALRELRLRVQPVADHRPAIQRVVGGQLRAATQLLERDTFDATQQAKFNERLQEVETWTARDTLPQKYRAALLDRVDGNAGVNPTAIGDPLGPQAATLLENWPTPAQINDPSTPFATLEDFDQRFEKLALLLRDAKESWAAALADGFARNLSLRELFGIVDRELWNCFDAKKDTITLARAGTREASVQVYEPFEMEVSIPGFDRIRVLKHPMRIGWTIQAPNRTIRLVETEDLGLTQYFTSRGTATIKAQLHWAPQAAIEVPKSTEVTVAKSIGFEWYRLFVQGGAVELAAIIVAVLFAVATALQTQYDSTFGSWGQYVGMFLWAAGAATGGNVLKQLGTTAVPDGQADASLPAKP